MNRMLLILMINIYNIIFFKNNNIFFNKCKIRKTKKYKILFLFLYSLLTNAILFPDCDCVQCGQ